MIKERKHDPISHDNPHQRACPASRRWRRMRSRPSVAAVDPAAPDKDLSKPKGAPHGGAREETWISIC